VSYRVWVFDKSQRPSTLASITAKTLNADIRPVHQRFGEVKLIFVLPDERHANVIFVDAMASNAPCIHIQQMLRSECVQAHRVSEVRGSQDRGRR
jgi:hypothetical protein